MKEQIVSFKVAKLAKEKGFDIECDRSFYTQGHDLIPSLLNSNYKYSPFLCIAPTQSLLQKWLREKHKIIILIDIIFDDFVCKIRKDNETEFVYYNNHVRRFKVYEQALEVGLYKALKLI